MTAATASIQPCFDEGFRIRSERRSCDAGGSGGTTRETPGSGTSASSTRSSKSPRGSTSPCSGGKPPCSGIRITTPRASTFASALRAGKVTLKISGSSLRPRSVIAPERSHKSQPPPSQAAHDKFRGTSNSMTSPDSSHSRGTRIRCTTSGPRGVSSVRVVTLARTSDTSYEDSANRAPRKRGLAGSAREVSIWRGD